MLILPGNAAPAGKYPDEQGIKIAWPNGALHRGAAREYAWLKGYVPQVVEKSGWPQSETSPQAAEAVRWFLADQLFNRVTAFYGFSGGGGNLMYILDRLGRENPVTEEGADRRCQRAPVYSTGGRRELLRCACNLSDLG